MGRALRVLVAEDSEDDYLLLLRELRRCGFDVTSSRVDTVEGMRAALQDAHWDFVFSDWSMPHFEAPDALRVLHESNLDLPFVIYSGTVGEETAVEALRKGAHDFLLKGRLARLGAIVERELREVGVRRERIKMQEQLVVSDRMASIGILAAGVAHEINNPLAAVLANLDLAIVDIPALDPTDPDFSAARKALLEEVADARVAADRVRNIVRDLRVFSRGDEEPRGPVDIEKVMESTLRMAANELRHRAKLVRKFAPVRPVDASEARLGQVFLNLIMNAAQALPDGHADRNEIRVSLAEEAGRARIDIVDTGPGIPPEVLHRLFTPFVTTKSGERGTGLGLSICHRIVSNLGGEIRVDTGAGGTTFTVYLPISAGGADAQPTQPLPHARAARRGRVLIVDDEAMLGRAMQRALSADHDVTTTTSARDALDRITRGERYDVILCDLMMPEMNGVELHDALARVAADQTEAMVFLTGGAFTESAREFIARVRNPVLEKPFEAQHLRALVGDRVR